MHFAPEGKTVEKYALIFGVAITPFVILSIIPIAIMLGLYFSPWEILLIDAFLADMRIDGLADLLSVSSEIGAFINIAVPVLISTVFAYYISAISSYLFWWELIWKNSDSRYKIADKSHQRQLEQRKKKNQEKTPAAEQKKIEIVSDSEELHDDMNDITKRYTMARNKIKSCAIEIDNFNTSMQNDFEEIFQQKINGKDQILTLIADLSETDGFRDSISGDLNQNPFKDSGFWMDCEVVARGQYLHQHPITRQYLSSTWLDNIEINTEKQQEIETFVKNVEKFATKCGQQVILKKNPTHCPQQSAEYTTQAPAADFLRNSASPKPDIYNSWYNNH